MTSIFAACTASSEVQAQVYYYPSSSPRVFQQNRVIVGSSNGVYSNNGVQYRSYRPNYGQTQVYPNGSYYVQPRYPAAQNPTNYYSQPAPSYSGYSNYPGYSSPQPTYYGNQGNWSQPTTTYQSNYGTGYYSPQQTTNANVGAIIGNAIGGQQGAQVGAAIGSTIRP